MIGLEYVLYLYKVQHSDLANELGIAKQNINRWIKGERKIPTKYLPVLSERFKIPEEYFSKAMDKYDEAKLQMIKFNNELLKSKEEIELRDSNGDIVGREVIYDGNLIPDIEALKYKVEVAETIKDVEKHLQDNDNNAYISNLDSYKLFNKVLDADPSRRILKYILRALEIHYCRGFNADENVEVLLNAIRKIDNNK